MRVRLTAAALFAVLALNAQERRLSLEKEAALGERVAAEFVKSATPLESPLVQRYLDRLTARLSASLPDAPFPFTVRAVLEERCGPTHEPAAMPGGFIFVSAALFDAAESEAEFAGMLAQAMERSAGRLDAERSIEIGAGKVPLVMLGAPCRMGLMMRGGFAAAPMQQEQAADSRAVDALRRAGYDPAALLSYLARTPHALAEDRLAALRNKVREAGPPPLTPPSGDYFAVQAEIRTRLVPPGPGMNPPTLRRN